MSNQCLAHIQSERIFGAKEPIKRYFYVPRNVFNYTEIREFRKVDHQAMRLNGFPIIYTTKGDKNVKQEISRTYNRERIKEGYVVVQYCTIHYREDGPEHEWEEEYYNDLKTGKWEEYFAVYR